MPFGTPPFARVVFERPGLREELEHAGIHDLEALSSRGLGHEVVTHRSSWVRRVKSSPADLFVKTYVYPGLHDVLRGVGRTTFLARSRPRREFEALTWLRGHGFDAPEPLGVYELRRLGLLRRAVLVTRAWPGRPLDSLLPTLDHGKRDDLLRALEGFVERLHRMGFRDRNLDLRNLLAGWRRDHWVLAKLDSPRFRLVAPGRTTDRLARRDWERLARSLSAALGRPTLRPQDG